QNAFGNVNGTAFPSDWITVPGVNTGGMLRYNFGRTSVGAADYLVTLPDSWSHLHDETGINPVTGTNATGTTQIDVPGLFASGMPFPYTPPPTGTVAYRAVLFSADGRASQFRNITSVSGAGDTISWSEDVDN